ncbi:MAG TPA: flagellar brake protein [Anaerovoracaceae bacterium]|nr:flagellar brake protein [Anaerovoracaceae bacterium]
MIGIRPGDKLEITAQTDDGAKCSYTSHIEKIVDEDLLLVHAPISAGCAVKLPLDEEYGFLFFALDGLYRAKGTVLGHYIQNEALLTEIEVDEYERVRQRSFFRIDVAVELTFSRVADSEEAGDMPDYKGMVKNISGSGMSFESGVWLETAEYILCWFTLNCNFIMIKGKVLDYRSGMNEEGNYEYRVEFADIDNITQDKVIQYIFEKQREMLKRNQ